MKLKNYTTVVTCCALTLLIGACGDSGSDGEGGSGQGDVENIVLIDATAGGSGASTTDPANKFTYFDLDTGTVLELTDAEAESDLDWDIAFKRTNTKINGGASGPASVSAALAEAQDDFYDANGDAVSDRFLNATAETEQAIFDQMTDASALVFEQDANSPKIDGSLVGEDSWALYDSTDHSISAQPDAWNIVKSAAGNVFAKFHVTDIVQTTREITLELFIQQDGETEFSTTASNWTASIGEAGGALCYDLDTETEVDCDTLASDWDLMVEVSASGFEWNIWTNGGIMGEGAEGGAYGTIQTADFSYLGVGDGDDLFPERYLEADAPSGVFLENSWYAYNLKGNHKLWPNYRVFAIDVDGVIYKLQYLSYYDEAAVSGMLSIRYEQLM